MLTEYASVVVFAVFAILFVAINLFVSRLLAPRLENVFKQIPYECGEQPVGTPWIRFNPRYFLYALTFLIFEIEIVLILPCIVVYRSWINDGQGMVAFIEIFLFVFVLACGFAYLWRRGLLSWMKPHTIQGS